MLQKFEDMLRLLNSSSDQIMRRGKQRLQVGVAHHAATTKISRQRASIRGLRFFDNLHASMVWVQIPASTVGKVWYAASQGGACHVSCVGFGSILPNYFDRLVNDGQYLESIIGSIWMPCNLCTYR